MAEPKTFVLIHGAGSNAWSWHRVAAELTAHGHDVVAMDLPCEDDTAGLADYVDAVVEAIGDRTDLVLVAQSLAGFTAPLVCERLPVDLLVLVAAMVPKPGETGGEWWTATGHDALPSGDEEFDPERVFLHDVPTELAAEATRRARDQSGRPMADPWPLAAWPDVPTRFLLCRQDRLFPAEWLRGVVEERLGFTPDELDAGHVPALGHPRELAERLLAYVAELDPPRPYTCTRLTDVRNAAPGSGHEMRFATEAMGTTAVGLAHHRLAAGLRPDFAHRHQEAEEVYVVLSGSGRLKLDDDVLDVGRLDAIRVAPAVWRAWEAGPDGLEVLVFGAHHPGDGETATGFWPADAA